jgi:hypothetical protein
MTTTQRLERAAIDAHRAGIGFGQFWNEHKEAVRMSIPRDRVYTTYRRLLNIVLCGDDADVTSADDLPLFRDDREQWFQDDDVQVDDVQTQARLQIKF